MKTIKILSFVLVCASTFMLLHFYIASLDRISMEELHEMNDQQLWEFANGQGPKQVGWWNYLIASLPFVSSVLLFGMFLFNDKGLKIFKFLLHLIVILEILHYVIRALFVDPNNFAAALFVTALGCEIFLFVDFYKQKKYPLCDEKINNSTKIQLGDNLIPEQNSIVRDLERLSKMKESGVFTNDEYESAKNKIISSIE